MKILYATVLTTPLQEVLEGKDQISGLPGFYYPMRMLMERGHEVNFVILLHQKLKLDVKADWFNRNAVKALVRYVGVQESPRTSVLSKPIAYLRFMWEAHSELRREQYDFVYCKATEALGAQIVARLHKVPVGVRWFGDTISDDIEKYGVYGAALRKPLHFLGFKTRCSFMLMTDDNPAKGHKYRAWLPKKNPYNLHIWKSGIEFKDLENLEPSIPVPPVPYIFCASRFDPVKRQDRVVEILRELHDAGHALHLYFAGEVSNQDYFSQVTKLVESYGLEAYVHVLGPIPNDDVRNLAYHAVSNHFMYDKTLNLGNVFYETFSMGGIVVALNDGSLNGFLIDGVNGRLVDDEKEASDAVIEVLEYPDFRGRLRKNALSSARETVLSAAERFGREVELIESFEIRSNAKRDST